MPYIPKYHAKYADTCVCVLRIAIHPSISSSIFHSFIDNF